MFPVIDYSKVASKNEKVFRNILKDLVTNREERPMGFFVPVDLDLESTVVEIYKKYSTGNRMGIFTIRNFKIKDNIAKIAFQDIAPLSGGGVTLVYRVHEDKSISYSKSEGVIMS